MKNTAEVCLAAGGTKPPKSGFMLMEKLDTGKQAVPLADAVVRLIRESGLPVRSITTDNGPEFAAHEIIARVRTARGRRELLRKVASPVVGATKLHHIDGAVAALDLKLTEEYMTYL